MLPAVQCLKTTTLYILFSFVFDYTLRIFQVPIFYHGLKKGYLLFQKIKFYVILPL